MKGQILIFAGLTPPTNWRFCHGQELSILGNEELFSIIGITYGGDGVDTFKLPDLRGKFVLGSDTNKPLGNAFGSEEITLNTSNLPQHSHNVKIGVNTEAANTTEPSGNVLGDSNDNLFNSHPVEVGETLAGVSEELVGNNQPVNILNPCLSLNYIIQVD